MMVSLKKVSGALGGAALLALLIAGCGAQPGAGQSSNVSSGSNAAGGNTAGSTGSAASLLDQLKSGQRTLEVGTDATFPPFEFTDAAGQKMGFDIDLVNDITKQIGIPKVDFKQVPFAELVPDLTANHIDMAASAIYITPEREKVVDFSTTYFPGGLTILVKDSNQTIHGPKDLAGKRVAVQVGTKSVNWLKQNVPSAQLVVVQTNDQMFNSIQTGQADAVVTGYPAARYYIQKHGGAKTVGPLLTKEEYGFAFRKSDKDLLNAVNTALDALQKDGTIKQLEIKWFGEAQ
ncbi:MAG: transporter substrate-binding domain-containing protein [Alicyclobacillus macrosporangiidus]|uniref:transporter substrate-binding domain-containing protein n=1 Tax=Alicyclobacillus macrosporangiidus TaxID=392015 RepID=UPI0026EB419C|nr:transporter substrate-binding domain-containing protein [Alicyclobacillus macrosporangiidus]MCL6600715.1 transporter substrate-binding domain-containing protein [Alicyclobacillus macrosporangiidus]